MNQNGEIYSSDGDRRDGFSLNLKLFTAIKECVPFFSAVCLIHFILTFSYAVLTSYHSLR